MMEHRAFYRLRRITAFWLCILMIAAMAATIPVAAKSEPKVVRVGWYESSFNHTDENGRKSGYAYDYQLKIAAYAGWEYDYVRGSWPDLMQMLIDGKIDMLSDVSYTEERSQKMLFPELPMGTEEYYIFISPKNHEITADDYSTLNGKRVGVNKGSIQVGFYQSWAEHHGIDAELVELTITEDEAIEKLNAGGLDAYITPNAFADPDELVPVCKIGSSDFFFAVNSDRSDLLGDLNAAMSRIQDEDPYYNHKMFEKYVQRFGSNAFLSSSEEEWLSQHGAIRVGYQDNYLAFCAKDPDTGELTGALKDFLENAADCFTDAHLDFEPVAYSTVADAFEALENGEIDAVFPANLSGYGGESQGLLLTSSMVRSDVYAVVRQNDKSDFNSREHVVVAVNEGNPNYTAFLEENYPEWRTVTYPTTDDCLKAVYEGVADCVLISSFRYNNISKQCDKYRLTTFATGIGMDYCFAVNKGDTELYSILSKTIGLVHPSTINAALAYYIAEDSKVTLLDFIKDNLIIVLIVITVLVLFILLQLMWSRRSVKRAKKLITATETDDLTGLYNRDYFFQYTDRMYHEHPDAPKDAIVLNIEQFHTLNALNGRDFGDRVLRVLGIEIRMIAEEFGGIAGRSGADGFDIYCRHIEDYQAVFNRLQHKLDAISSNASIRLRMGVMPWQPKIEPIHLFDRAGTACSMARGNYKEHLIVFDEKVREQELTDQKLMGDLRRALDENEFEVFYQPKFDIRTEKPTLVGAEALIRWQHHELGLITPDKFIPLFERNGKITEIDKYIWARAAKQVADWKTWYGVTLPVSVNLSRVDVFDADLENTLDDILDRTGLQHDALKLEITESAYTENAEQLLHVAKSLHRKGYTIEMDDFGTGYSSLNMLSLMPIDVLKMDRGFVRNIDNNEKDSQMVSLILGIAKNLDIPVIAEGVETEAQLKLLKDLGCAYVQGYYFSQPLHPSEFEAKFLD